MSIDKVLETLRNSPKAIEKAIEKKRKSVAGPNWIGKGKPPHSVACRSPVVRTVMIMTHYKAPLAWGPTKLTEAEKLWKSLYAKVEKCDDAPPQEVVDAIEQDMNTPRAFSAMDRYARASEGRKLYAAMNYLGLLPENTEAEVVAVT
jgi:hypothetical protein